MARTTVRWNSTGSMFVPASAATRRLPPSTSYNSLPSRSVFLIFTWKGIRRQRDSRSSSVRGIIYKLNKSTSYLTEVSRESSGHLRSAFEQSCGIAGNHEYSQQDDRRADGFTKLQAGESLRELDTDGGCQQRWRHELQHQDPRNLQGMVMAKQRHCDIGRNNLKRCPCG